MKISKTPNTFRAACDAWFDGDAVAVPLEFAQNQELKIRQLRKALRSSACPMPTGNDDGSAGCCVKRKHCKCDNKSALK
jgi:hypothetical protein